MHKRFGRDGLLVWVLLLAAAKRGHPEGQITYVTAPNFWNLVGLTGDEPEFTPDEFLTFAGQLKQTVRRRHGDVVDVTLTHWEEWQDTFRREDERERKSRKRQETRADALRTSNGHAADTLRDGVRLAGARDAGAPRGSAPMDVGSKVLSEGSVVGSSSNASPLPTKSAKEPPVRKERKPDPLWDALVEVLHSSPQTSSERGRWNAALRELREADATAADVRSRSLAYQRRYPDAQLTPTALSANWGSLAPPRKAEPPCPECGVGGGKHSAGCPNGAADLRAIAEGMNQHR